MWLTVVSLVDLTSCVDCQVEQIKIVETCLKVQIGVAPNQERISLTKHFVHCTHKI
jgi:hypothetical protein